MRSRTRGCCTGGRMRGTGLLPRPPIHHLSLHSPRRLHPNPVGYTGAEGAEPAWCYRVCSLLSTCAPMPHAPCAPICAIHCCCAASASVVRAQQWRPSEDQTETFPCSRATHADNELHGQQHLSLSPTARAVLRAPGARRAPGCGPLALARPDTTS